MNILLAHLWPGFDAVWPNILASVIFAGPALLTHHVLLRKHFTNKIAETVRVALVDESQKVIDIEKARIEGLMQEPPTTSVGGSGTPAA